MGSGRRRRPPRCTVRTGAARIGSTRAPASAGPQLLPRLAVQPLWLRNSVWDSGFRGPERARLQSHPQPSSLHRHPGSGLSRPVGQARARRASGHRRSAWTYLRSCSAPHLMTFGIGGDASWSAPGAHAVRVPHRGTAAAGAAAVVGTPSARRSSSTAIGFRVAFRRRFPVRDLTTRRSVLQRFDVRRPPGPSSATPTPVRACHGFDPRLPCCSIVCIPAVSPHLQLSASCHVRPA